MRAYVRTGRCSPKLPYTPPVPPYPPLSPPNAPYPSPASPPHLDHPRAAWRRPGVPLALCGRPCTLRCCLQEGGGVPEAFPPTPMASQPAPPPGPVTVGAQVGRSPSQVPPTQDSEDDTE